MDMDLPFLVEILLSALFSKYLLDILFIFIVCYPLCFCSRNIGEGGKQSYGA